MTITCILLAPARSGTTVLGYAVTQSFTAAWPQEIFNEAFADPSLDYRNAPDVHHRTNFFNFRHEMLRKRPELSYPSRENQEFLFRTYLDHLSELEQAERLLVDIKYTSLHHLNTYWNLPSVRPGLVSIIRELKLPVVHLSRRNLFALYCSLAYAKATGVWETLHDLNAQQMIVIDTAECQKYMTEIETVSKFVRGWFFEYPVFELEYETMLEEGKWSDQVCDMFSQIYGVRPSTPLAMAYRKTTPPLGKIVRNAEEVLVALHGSPFHAMAEEALRGG